MKKSFSIAVVFVICILVFASCGSTKIDYTTAEDLESALNAGEDASGKTVSAVIKEVVTNSAFGYNLQSGEHLNFCSDDDPKVSAGDTITVKIKSVKSTLGSYIISYELIDIAKGNGSVPAITATQTYDATSTKAETTTDEVSTTAPSITTAAAATTTVTDYQDASSLELALNSGVDVTGKTVTFTVVDFKPNSSFGYNLMCGEHLNFCSTSHPGVNIGDSLSVKITSVQNVLGSYIISYEKLG